MEILIQNCNNITSGKISLTEGSLNIKYAINGTGKSSIAKLISASCPKKDSDIKKLIPYNTNLTPTLTGLDGSEKISVFNEDYINRYLFQKDDIISNAFSVFIKTRDYDERMNAIMNLLSEIRKKFESNKELDNLIIILTDFLASYGKANGLSKAGSLFKGLGEGNKIDNIPDGLNEYAPYLKHKEDSINVDWLNWVVKGKPFIPLANQCPFCSNPGKTTETKTKLIYDTYDSKKIEHLNKVLEIFQKLEPYLGETAKNKIYSIRQNVNGITKDDQIFLEEIKSEANNLHESLSRVKNFNFFSLKDVRRLQTFLESAKINICTYSKLTSKKLEIDIQIINDSIADIETNVNDLQREIGIQKARIISTINTHKKKINYFLECAGYNYQVDIEFSNEENAKLLLLPKGIEDVSPISNVKDHLSYGERNAFALILFVYSALSEGTKIFVFDDPISSFDGNKRFSIISMLFLDETPLRDKTVLLLSHDFSIVVDIMSTLALRFANTVHPHAHFLINHDGLLEEKEITKEKIRTFCSIMKENAKKEIHSINRAIYLRRYYEVNDEKGNVWDILSCLFHHRARNRVCRKTLEGEEILSDEDFNTAINKIREYIENFDYDDLLAQINDAEEMKQIYRASESNYEKLQIYRIIKGEGAQYHDNVVRKFVNETFHVDNNYIYQLDPREFETVPKYIVDICNREILGE